MGPLLVLQEMLQSLLPLMLPLMSTVLSLRTQPEECSLQLLQLLLQLLLTLLTLLTKPPPPPLPPAPLLLLKLQLLPQHQKVLLPLTIFKDLKLKLELLVFLSNSKD